MTVAGMSLRHRYLYMPKRNSSPTPLRHIAVYVREPKPGRFAWVLTEASEDMSTWSDLEVAEEWANSYRVAMAEGLLALQQIVPDLEAGPREEPPAAAKPRGNVFGFGFGANLG